MNQEELERMLHSDDWKDRLWTARQGYGLDILVNDKDRVVRQAVAEQGYGLETLVNDKERNVRYAVVKQGYGLDVLVKDADWVIRCGVVEQGYGLDILVDDENKWVRLTVAEQGYGLEKLLFDKDKEISSTAFDTLKSLIEEGKVKINRETEAKRDYDLDILIHDERPSVRLAVAKQSYGIEQLLLDEDNEVSFTAFNTLRSLMKEGRAEVKLKNLEPKKTKPIERD